MYTKKEQAAAREKFDNLPRKEKNRIIQEEAELEKAIDSVGEIATTLFKTTCSIHTWVLFMARCEAANTHTLNVVAENHSGMVKDARTLASETSAAVAAKIKRS